MFALSSNSATNSLYESIVDLVDRTAFPEAARAAGLNWPLPPGLDDAALEKQLFPPPPPPSVGQRPQPDFAVILIDYHVELEHHYYSAPLSVDKSR